MPTPGATVLDFDPIFDISADPPNEANIRLAPQGPHAVLIGPVGGGSASPTFRVLGDSDIPSEIARDSEVTTALAAYQKTSEKDAASGYLGLTANKAVTMAPNFTGPASIDGVYVTTTQTLSEAGTGIEDGITSKVVLADAGFNKPWAGGFFSYLWKTGAGVLTLGYGLRAKLFRSEGTITEYAALFVDTPLLGQGATTMEAVKASDLSPYTPNWRPLHLLGGLSRLSGRLKLGADSDPAEVLDVAGNIAVSGLVDGRDVSADGTKLDGISADAKYLIGEADANLPNAIVAGPTPSGDLGGPWNNIMVNITHAGSAHHSHPFAVSEVRILLYSALPNGYSRLIP
jgi:hypothetical protein